MKCDICNKTLKKSFYLGKVPLADDLKKEKKKSLKLKKYPIEILYCGNCQTLFQKKIVNKRKLFHSKYHYRPRFTKDVLNGMKTLVQSIKNIKKISNKKILDIGCNDGSLLDFFKNENCETYGIEPTNAAYEADKKHKILNSFFNEFTAKKFIKKFGYPDVVIFTNVFAHIENIKELLRSLKLILKRKNVILVIENHYLLSILKKFQFDTFYHEHLRTYSLNSFYNISKQLNMNLFKYEFPKRYGGNVRIFMKVKEDKNDVVVRKKLNLFLKREKILINKNLIIFKKKLKNWFLNKKKFFKKINKLHGPVQAKSYPARASLIINLLELNSQHISNIYEKHGSKKIGYYVPGTDIKIISDKQIINKKKLLINFSWHIKNEIKNYMQKLNYKGKIINIL